MFSILTLLIGSLLAVHFVSLCDLEASTDKAEKEVAETQEGATVKLLRYFPRRLLISDEPITLIFDGTPTNFKIENPRIKNENGRAYPKIANVNVMDKSVEITVTAIGFLKEPLQVSWKGGSAELAFRTGEL